MLRYTYIVCLFKTETKCVYCAVRNESLNITENNLSLPAATYPVTVLLQIQDNYKYITSSSSSSFGTTARFGLWPVEQCPSIFFYPTPTFSIFSLPALKDIFLLPLPILSWAFPFASSLRVLQWRSFWASYPPPFSPGDLTNLFFAILSILLYFVLCSSLLFLHSPDFSIPRCHI